jgi:hypothetical protein
MTVSNEIQLDFRKKRVQERYNVEKREWFLIKALFVKIVAY